jgi:hypothetical protein
MTLLPFDRDYAEMLAELSAADAEFLIVGAHALAAHVQPRNTQDLDIWIRPTPENAQRVWVALTRYEAPLEGLTVEELAKPGLIYQIGVAPKRIDILTAISGVEFDDAWAHRIMVHFAEGTFPVIGREELLRNKRATGRPKDLLDVRLLESQ